MKPLTAPSFKEEVQSFPSLEISSTSFPEALWAICTKKNGKAGKLAYRVYVRRVHNFITSTILVRIVSIVVSIIWLAMIITTVFFV